ncbi:RICIN domain-containing protein [Streptomyces sp. NPDC014892]|uniref:RICIN domain-containing protein n=1 Tax=Streptomyces sp. NPDC014892 TaxID=3364930 RepID=UPI0036FF19A5
MRFAAPMLVVAMLASVLVTLGTPNRANAAVQDYQPATYNMQGGNTTGANKWLTDIPQLIRAGYNVISLQEAGPQPPGTYLGQTRYMAEAENWAGWRVRQYRWQPPGQSNNWYIYFVRTDFGGNRVNLAILTRFQADSVSIAQAAFYGNNGTPSSRPALGITLGNTLFFSVHAMATGGNDGAQLLRNIQAIAGFRTWAAMGDWNRGPSLLPVTRGMHRYTAGAPTHQSGGELDYMVSNSRIAGYGGVVRGMSSDHYAVGFRRLAANADVQLLNAHDGNRALQFANNIGGTFMVVGTKKAGTYGHWRFLPKPSGLYQVRNTSSGKCWRDGGDGLVTQWDCNSDNNQLFDLNYWSDTGQLKIRPTSRSTCVGDDPDFGYGSQIVTTMSCSKGEARLNFRFDRDPGPNAPLIVF